MKKYKAGKSKYSSHEQAYIRKIYVRTKILWFIPIWKFDHIYNEFTNEYNVYHYLFNINNPNLIVTPIITPVIEIKEPTIEPKTFLKKSSRKSC